MAEGLLQMLGGGQQAQQQQQGNLLGGLFQSESQARRQGRKRLLGQALQIAQQQDPIGTGFAVAGGLLGEGIGRAMGRVTPEEARQQKFAGLQTQLMQEGLDPTQNPFGFYARAAELLREQGDNQMSLRASAKAREFAPEPVELPATARTLAFRAQQAGLERGTPEYQEFMRTGGEIPQGPTTTVNVGQQGQQFPDPPKDTVWARDEQGRVLTEEREVDGRIVRAPVSVPITGSKPAREAEKERREREFSARSANRAASIVVDDFDYLLRGLGADPETGEIAEDADPSVVGPRMRMAAEQGTFGANVLFTGRESGDFLRQLESARNTIAVDQLLNIKREGSGLGQVPQSQLNTLSTLLGSLEAGLSNEKLAENLARAKRLYTNIIETSLQDVDDPTFRGEVLDIAGMAEERGVFDETNGKQNGAGSSEGEVVDWSDL